MQNHPLLVTKDCCAWPNLFRIDDGTIGAVIFNRPSHGLQEGSLELWQMVINSQKWTHLSTPAPNVPGQNRMHSCCGVSPGGAIHILSTGFSITDGKFVRLEPTWHSFSYDGGRNWTIEKDLRIDNIEPQSIPHGSILFRPDGRLLASVYRSFGRGEKSYTWCIESSDQGRSWKKHSLIGSGDTNEAWLICSSDTLFATVRTHVDHHTRLYSSNDSDEEWLDRGPLTLPMQHPGHLLSLDQQTLLLTYGIRNKGLMAIGGRFSFDLGKNWQPPFVLHQFPEETSDCGYPSTVRISEDSLVTGYYTNLSPEYEGYQFGALTWQLSHYSTKHPLRSISNGSGMKV